jgi:hypothetical protein
MTDNRKIVILVRDCDEFGNYHTDDDKILLSFNIRDVNRDTELIFD